MAPLRSRGHEGSRRAAIIVHVPAWFRVADGFDHRSGGQALAQRHNSGAEGYRFEPYRLSGVPINQKQLTLTDHRESSTVLGYHWGTTRGDAQPPTSPVPAGPVRSNSP
jgi:hypothetical protein